MGKQNGAFCPRCCEKGAKDIMVLALRGAICLDSDAPDRIHDAANRLVREVCKRNGLGEDEIVSIVFSITSDLRSANPAQGLRRSGFAHTPLFCVQEAETDGGMRRVIRVLVTVEKRPAEGLTAEKVRREAVHVYLDGAETLRPDIGA
jgi:chorismate mutase